MALIECKECGHKISEHAVKCPKCGADSKLNKVVIPPVIPEEVEKPIEIKKENKKIVEPTKEAVVDVNTNKKKKRGPLLLIIGSLIIIMLIGIFTIDFGGNSNSELNSNTNELFKKISDEANEQKQAAIDYQKIKDKELKKKERRNKELVNNNLGNYLKASANDYKQKLLGGIKNLRITVSNSSDYTMEQVIVEVKYHKLNNKLYTTKNLYFKNLKANSNMTLFAPETNVGTYVKYKIIEVKPPSLN
jgi:ribosomal protein L32